MKCRICGKSYITVKYRIDRFSLLECHNCGIVYSHPQDMKEKIPTTQFSFISYLHYLWSFVRFKQYFKIIMKEAIHKQSLLDLGCGHGVLLRIARKEMSIKGVEQCPTLFLKGVPYTKSRIEDYKSKDKFDIINMKDVLEHIKDPVLVLNKVYSWLNDDGTLVISVPDISSREATNKKEEWKRIAPREHLFYFSQESLDCICTKIGFIPGGTYEIMPGTITCFYYKL